MTERPIIFSAPMVRAILSNAKTQTRRVVKPQPTGFAGGPGVWLPNGKPAPLMPMDDTVLPFGRAIACSYGEPGDRLWVRETHIDLFASCLYRADANAEEERAMACPGVPWRPPNHMRRLSSRITLEVTSVRAELLQDISHDDAIAEGVHSVEGAPLRDQRLTVPQHLFAHLWESLHGPGSWDANPWVWVVGFRRITEAGGRP